MKVTVQLRQDKVSVSHRDSSIIMTVKEAKELAIELLAEISRAKRLKVLKKRLEGLGFDEETILAMLSHLDE